MVAAIAMLLFGSAWSDEIRSANDLRLRGRYAEAHQIYTRALTIGRGWEVPATLNNLAALEEDRANLREAQRLYERSIAEWRRSANPAGAAYPLRNLAALLWRLNRLKPAEQRFREAAELVETPDVLDALGRLTMLNGKPKDSVVWYERALKHADERTRPDLLARLAEAQFAAGMPSEAKSTAKQAVHDATGEPGAVRARLVLAMTHSAAGEHSPAAELLERAAEIARRQYGEQHSLTLCVYAEYAAVLSKLGRNDEAAWYRNAAIAGLRTRPERHTVSVADLLERR